MYLQQSIKFHIVMINLTSKNQASTNKRWDKMNKLKVLRSAGSPFKIMYFWDNFKCTLTKTSV